MADKTDPPNQAPGVRSVDDDCPLPVATQRRNIYCFAGIWSLYYLAAPVSYIGITHANLLKELEHSNTVANFPGALYQWLSVCAVLVAWFLPNPRLLKPLLLTVNIVMACICAVVAAVLWLDLSRSVITVAIIAHGAVFGACSGVMLTTMWEFVRRGVSTSRRGHTLALTFGVGPLFACLGALAQQAIFSERPIGGFSLGYAFPTNYLVLFAAVVPILLACAALSAMFVVPVASNEPPTGVRAAEIVGGLREFLTCRPLVMGAVAYLLVYSGGNAIFANVSIHAKTVLESQVDTQGVQQFLRFGFKAATGFLLGYLLAKTNPKATLLATTSILILAMGWVLNSQGRWYLLSFGLLGSGELFGAYFPNYIATASRKARVRLNVAYLSLLSSLVGLANMSFGYIADQYGLVASFYTAAGVLLFAMGLIVIVLPAQPTPREETGAAPADGAATG